MHFESLNLNNLKLLRKSFLEKELKYGFEYLNKSNFKLYFKDNEEVLLKFFKLDSYDKIEIKKRLQIIIFKVFIKHHKLLINEKYFNLHKYYIFYKHLKKNLILYPENYDKYHFVLFHNNIPISIVNTKLSKDGVKYNNLLQNLKININNKNKKQYLMKDVISIIIKEIRREQYNYKTLNIKKFFEDKDKSKSSNTKYCLMKTKEIVKNGTFLRKRKHLYNTNLNKKNFTSIMSTFLVKLKSNYYNEEYSSEFFRYLKLYKIENNFFNISFNDDNILFNNILKNYYNYINCKLSDETEENDYNLYYKTKDEYINNLNYLLKSRQDKKRIIKSLNPKKYPSELKDRLKNTFNLFTYFKINTSFQDLIEVVDSLYKKSIDLNLIYKIVDYFNLEELLIEDNYLKLNHQLIHKNIKKFKNINKLVKECKKDKTLTFLLNQNLEKYDYIFTHIDVINNNDYILNNIDDFLFDLKQSIRDKYIEQFINFENKLNISRSDNTYYIALHMNLLDDYLNYLNFVYENKNKFLKSSKYDSLDLNHIQIVNYKEPLSYFVYMLNQKYNNFKNNLYYLIKIKDFKIVSIVTFENNICLDNIINTNGNIDDLELNNSIDKFKLSKN